MYIPEIFEKSLILKTFPKPHQLMRIILVSENEKTGTGRGFVVVAVALVGAVLFLRVPGRLVVLVLLFFFLCGGSDWTMSVDFNMTCKVMSLCVNYMTAPKQLLFVCKVMSSVVKRSGLSVVFRN